MNPHMLDTTTRHCDPMLQADEAKLGTAEYTGHAWFWNHFYRHEMRQALPATRKKIHDALIAAGLKLDDEGQEHDRIITAISTNPAAPWPPVRQSEAEFIKSHLILSHIR